ncbi:MAG: GNAT family N-acetyltransferase [Streptosporangiales bacterium]|nr:GNAT family N-acetyltransferase [Streptosporangiales bacterium]
MDDLRIRYAEDEDLAALAALRWRWVVEENGKTPRGTRDEFIAAFVTWSRGHAASHRWIIATRGDSIIGMACLAAIPRVPHPQSPGVRASGDLQSVYVVPGERNSGLGGQILTAVSRQAGQLELERVTVHSSPGAVSAYERAGFEVSPLLLCRPTPRERDGS